MKDGKKRKSAFPGSGNRKKRLIKEMSLVVTFCTVYWMILPAITQSVKVYCMEEEHCHTADCYQVIYPENIKESETGNKVPDEMQVHEDETVRDPDRWEIPEDSLDHAVWIEVVNMPGGIELPETGGFGTCWNKTVGLMLMAVSLGGLWWNGKSKKERVYAKGQR